MPPKKNGDGPCRTTNIARHPPPRAQDPEISTSGAANRLASAFANSDAEAVRVKRQAKRRAGR